MDVVRSRDRGLTCARIVWNDTL